jgi:glyoxylase-like metal-dependent hydrolase (beta-lactamase superfamily II)
MPAISRRTLLTGPALAAASLAVSRAGFAAAPISRAQSPGAYRYQLGDYQLTALYDGTWYVPIDDKFVRNAGATAVNDALAAAFLPPNVLPVPFTALLVNTGRKLVLIDTGSAGQITDSAGFMNDNLAAASVKPGDIDTIVISHFHPDHINGIKTKDGDKVFANAEILVPEPEWAYWMDDSHMSGVTGPVHKYFLNARRIFKDIAGEVTRFKPGAEVAPGIESIPAYGHTLGHTAFVIHSGGQSQLVISDAAREPFLFVRHPEWQPSYDMDGPMAVKTRLAMLDRASTDRTPVSGYHFPFPACGHVAKAANGYELVPAIWQPL